MRTREAGFQTKPIQAIRTGSRKVDPKTNCNFFGVQRSSEECGANSEIGSY
jgi:hypothetical protein